MGSYTVVPKKPNETSLAFLRRVSGHYPGVKWASEETDTEHQVLEMVNGRQGVYGIRQATNRTTGKSVVTGFVVLVETHKGHGHYKLIDETEGPHLAFMPERLLKKLSPVEALNCPDREKQSARTWRASCAAHWDRKRSLRPGVTFSVPAPGFPFGSTRQVTLFKVEDPAKRIFVANPGTADQFRCQLRLEMVDTMDFTIHP